MKPAESSYRYPGVQPFRTDQQHLFFGRNADIEALFELVFTEKVTVLFGDSGYGKSSLLNAGILPRLLGDRNRRRYRFLPVPVRFLAWSGEADDTPLQKFSVRLADALPLNADGAFLDRPELPRSLWWQCMRRVPGGDDLPRLVFIFDQFEEFFTYPEAMREQFKAEFADVLYNTVPTGPAWTDEQEDFFAGRLEAKAVFSIRSDRLSLLDQLSDCIPTILRKRYELRGLSREQARAAIVQPALLAGEGFRSPRFEFTAAALDQILHGLSGGSQQSSRGVEAFQLQILCQYIETEVIKGSIPDRDGTGLPDVDVSDLPDLANIYEAYYRRQIEQMPAAEQSAARTLVEDGLLFVNEQTREARRLSMDADALLQRFRHLGVGPATLQRLQDAFLLRREANSLGGFNYEISHDTLIAPVLKARSERLAEEEQDRLKAEAALARQQQRIAERKRRNALLIATAGFVLAALATLAMVTAINARNAARASEQRAEKERLKAEDALELVLQKEREKNALQAQDKLKSAEKSIQAGFFGAAREDLEAALRLDTSAAVRAEVERLRRQIR